MRNHLKIWSTEVYSKYENGEILQFTDDFQSVAKRVRYIIQTHIEEQLYTQNFNAARFVLQCTQGWVITDRQVVENHTFDVTIGKKPEDDDE